MITKKVALLGSECVGKTSLVRRYVDQSFDENYKATIGVSISKKEIASMDLKLMIWDIEGGTKVFGKPNDYYSGSALAIFVADLKNKDTWKDVLLLHQFFIQHNLHAHHVVAFNKIDLISPDELQLKKNEVLDLCKGVFSHVFFTSALTGESTQSLFEAVFSLHGYVGHEI